MNNIEQGRYLKGNHIYESLIRNRIEYNISVIERCMRRNKKNNYIAQQLLTSNRKLEDLLRMNFNKDLFVKHGVET